MMLWRFSRDLYDRRGRGQDPLVGLTSEDADQGAAPRVLAHPGEYDSAVWEPQAGALETGGAASHQSPVTKGASRIAEAPYADGPLASRSVR